MFLMIWFQYCNFQVYRLNNYKFIDTNYKLFITGTNLKSNVFSVYNKV